VKPVLHCLLMVAIEGGEVRETRGNARGRGQMRCRGGERSAGGRRQARQVGPTCR
jgi:hypothetical protein